MEGGTLGRVTWDFEEQLEHGTNCVQGLMCRGDGVPTFKKTQAPKSRGEKAM